MELREKIIVLCITLYDGCNGSTCGDKSSKVPLLLLYHLDITMYPLFGSHATLQSTADTYDRSSMVGDKYLEYAVFSENQERAGR